MEKRDKINKIVFTGPECSGKTTLSNHIAKIVKAPIVNEYAREYLNNLDREYSYSDLLKIAKGQIELEESQMYSKSSSRLIICDTNLQVIKIWSQIKYSKCDPFILKNQDKKIEIMSLYESEIGKEPFPRSEQNIRSLAKFRGSTAGVLSAEAFILLKEII